MSDESLADRMEHYNSAAERARETAQERDRIAGEIDRELATHVESAITNAGAAVEQVGRSDDGHRVRFEARLDRAAMVAALTEKLPGGFVVSHVNDDGSLSIEWTGDGRTPGKRERGAVLKAIIAEETESDGDGLIVSVPSRERVLYRAEELGLDRGEADDRLARLVDLDVIDVAEGNVYPDSNFSRI